MIRLFLYDDKIEQAIISLCKNVSVLDNSGIQGEHLTTTAIPSKVMNLLLLPLFVCGFVFSHILIVVFGVMF